MTLPSPQHNQQQLLQQQQNTPQDTNLASNMGKHDIKRGIGHRQTEAGGKCFTLSFMSYYFQQYGFYLVQKLFEIFLIFW